MNPVLPHTPAQAKLFRKTALEQLASPEQLDTLMRVTSTQGWLALLGCGLLIASALSWGLWGSVPSKQTASGILIYGAGLSDVVAAGPGRVSAVEVRVGDRVRSGQVVARLAQPALETELTGLYARRRELQTSYAQSQELEGEDTAIRTSAGAQARTALRETIASTKQRERELEDRLAAQRRLLGNSLVTREQLQRTHDALRSARSTLQDLRTELRELDVSRLSVTRSNESERRELQARVQDNEREIQRLEQRVERLRILSTCDGRVVELRASLHEWLQEGQAVVGLECAAPEQRLEALLYVDSRQSKRIAPNMPVELSPTMARRESYGVLRGMVREVEDFPSTRAGMLRALRNEQLVDDVLAETRGVPTALRVRLRTDPSAESGYLWSSRRGAGLSLSSGTRCSAAVVTGAQRPLSLLFPVLERVL